MVGTRFAWFGMTRTDKTKQAQRIKAIENREKHRTMHGYLPPEMCESCRLSDCYWDVNARSCPLSPDWDERIRKRNERAHRSKEKKNGTTKD